MKKTTLIFIVIFSCLIALPTFAKPINSISYGFNYNNGEKFTFVERGITFSVFRNGEFDFYINPRNDVNTNINYGLVSISYNSGYNYDPYVQYDDYGAILQIENVPIYYDYYGRIIGAGNVKINYNANRLVRIGGLHIYYNAYGYYSHYMGFINPYNRYYSYHPYHNYFVRPYYNNCVVSYNPYRRHYKPERHMYYNDGRYYAKNYNKKRDYKKVESRIRTSDSDKRYQRQSSNNTAITRNSNRLDRLNLQPNVKSMRNANSRSQSFSNKEDSKQNVRSIKNNVSVSNNRISTNLRKERSTVSPKRTVSSSITQGKNLNLNKETRKNSNKKIKPQIKNISNRGMAKRSSSRNTNYKESKVKSSIRKTNTNSSAKRTVAHGSKTKKRTL